MCFKNIIILNEPTHKKLTNWSQIFERAQSASLLIDIKFVPYKISFKNVH